MKNTVFLFILFSSGIFSQITLLNTTTTVTLKHLSCIGNTILVGGQSGNYLAKSYDEGYSLIPLSCPGPYINYSYFQRLDKDTVFLLSTGNDAEIYRSTDGGNNWSK